MSIDAVAAIGARMTQIRALVEGVAQGTAEASSSSAADGGFEAALSEALAGSSGSWSSSGLAGSSGTAAGSSGSGLDSFAGLDGQSGLAGLFGGASLSGLSGLFGASSTAGGILGLGSISGLGGSTASSGLATGALAGSSSSTALTADGVPAELAAYGNGRIPEAALVPVGGSSERLWAPAAASLDRLIDAAAADGVTIGVTDGYRTYDAQVDLVRRKGLYSQGGLAAAPGTSEHGWGMAADLALDSSGLAWMRANAGRFGFAETTPRESWHWSYRPTS